MINNESDASKLAYIAPECIIIKISQTEKVATISGIDGFDIQSSWLRSGS